MSRRPRWDRRVLAGSLALAALAAAIVWARIDPGGEPAPRVAAAPAPEPDVARAEPRADPRPVPDPPTPEPPRAFDAPDGRRMPLDRPITDLDPDTRQVFEEHLARQQAAEERFQRGLERSQVRARDVDARVKDAFRRTELVPELVDGGRMLGLRIRDVEGGSPLHQAGFHAGDLLVRLDERPLDDPAELPDLLASAGPVLSLCARRGSSEFCRELTLR